MMCAASAYKAKTTSRILLARASYTYSKRWSSSERLETCDTDIDVQGKLHERHKGIVKCKSHACQSLWWPGLRQQISETLLKCRKCKHERHNHSKPLLPSEHPDHGKILGQSSLIWRGRCTFWLFIIIHGMLRLDTYHTTIPLTSQCIWYQYLHAKVFQWLLCQIMDSSFPKKLCHYAGMSSASMHYSANDSFNWTLCCQIAAFWLRR